MQHLASDLPHRVEGAGEGGVQRSNSSRRNHSNNLRNNSKPASIKRRQELVLEGEAEGVGHEQGAQGLTLPKEVISRMTQGSRAVEMKTDNREEADSKAADSRAVGRKEVILAVGPVAEPKEVEMVAGHNREAMISKVASAGMAPKASHKAANQDQVGEAEDEGQGVEAEEDAADHKGAIKVRLLSTMLAFEKAQPAPT